MSATRKESPSMFLNYRRLKMSKIEGKNRTKNKLERGNDALYNILFDFETGTKSFVTLVDKRLTKKSMK